VRIRHPNVTIRGRRWVMIPKRLAAAAPESTTSAPTPSAPAPAEPDLPPRRSTPPDVSALADAFDQGNAEAFQKALSDSGDLSRVIRGFRLSDSPWPHNRRRTAIFALELALAALRSEIGDVRDEGGRLLAEYHVRIREPGGPDAFECWWLLTEATALVGLFRPDNALMFIPRSVQRCPANARLQLAHAFVSEQQWVRGTTLAGQEAEIVARYEHAMTFSETETEARVRLARFLFGVGQRDRALATIDGIRLPAADVEIRYFAHLIRGHILRANGRADAAAEAFRAALREWPGAQSAQIALMTLMMTQGRRQEAASLANAVQAAPVDQYDPWWMYWLGDYRVYPAIFAKLRELGQ
jgi:hypothetical protein